MSRYQGGEQAKAGFYFNSTTWEILTLSGEGGVLAGNADVQFLRLPLPLLLVAAVYMCITFVIVMGYNWLVRRNKSAMESVRTFGADLHAVLMGRKVESKAAR